MVGVASFKNSLLSCFGKKKSPPPTYKIECPFAIKWEISKEKLKELEYIIHGHVKTQRFDASNLPGVQYYLQIYPNGLDGNRGETWIYLYVLTKNKEKVKSCFQLSIESVGFQEQLCYEHEYSYARVGKKCCTSFDLFDRQFFVNGKLTIKCQGTLSVERICEPTTKNEANEKWNNESILSNLWNASNKDFTIIVDGIILQTHKYVLAARSPIFDAMFNSGMKESIENQMEIIDFTYEIVEAALELLYDRKVSTLTLEEKMDVLRFIDKYYILDLKDALEISLIEDISSTSVCQIAKFSIAANFIELQKRCHDYMVACFRMNRTITDFEQLDKDFALKVLKYAFIDIIKT